MAGLQNAAPRTKRAGPLSCLFRCNSAMLAHASCAGPGKLPAPLRSAASATSPPELNIQRTRGWNSPRSFANCPDVLAIREATNLGQESRRYITRLHRVTLLNAAKRAAVDTWHESCSETDRALDESVERLWPDTPKSREGNPIAHNLQEIQMRIHAQKTTQLGALIAAVFDEAALYSSDPRVVSRLAIRAVRHMVRPGRRPPRTGTRRTVQSRGTP